MVKDYVGTAIECHDIHFIFGLHIVLQHSLIPRDGAFCYKIDIKKKSKAGSNTIK